MLSVLNLRVRFIKPVATRVEVCCYVSCKWPCSFVRCLGMSMVEARGVGQLYGLMVGRSIFMRVSKMALGCIVCGSLR